jgi:hypothetical protein
MKTEPLTAEEISLIRDLLTLYDHSHNITEECPCVEQCDFCIAAAAVDEHDIEAFKSLGERCGSHD